MLRLARFIPVGIALAVAGAIVFVAFQMNCELGEWHALQKIEHQHRATQYGSGIILTNLGRKKFLCVIGKTNKVWILLNPSCEPLIKRLPDASFHLSRGQLNDVLRSEGVDPAVQAFLRTATMPNSLEPPGQGR